MARKNAGDVRNVATYCYQCVAGPDLYTVRVENGVATEVEPNFEAAKVHPAGGRICVKAYGLVQKTYNPNRITTPMKRTNPNKGRDEDPGFVPISWDEALDIIGEKFRSVRAEGLRDKEGFPRLAASFGGGGTPTSYMGSFPAFLSAWGPIDMGFGSGQGVKCYHSEHLYGELWHRAFTVAADTPSCEFNLSFGANIDASGGVCGVSRHADARYAVCSGCKSNRIFQSLVLTPPNGAHQAEDGRGIHVRPDQRHAARTVARRPRSVFLKHHTSSPYLVGPNGYFLRDRETKKPLVWDEMSNRAVPFDTPDIDPRLGGAVRASGYEPGADEERWDYENVIACRLFTFWWKTSARRRPPGHRKSAMFQKRRCVARQRVRRPRPCGRNGDHRRARIAVPSRCCDAWEDGQQRLGRVRLLLGPDHAGLSGRRLGSAWRNARDYGAPESPGHVAPSQCAAYC